MTAIVQSELAMEVFGQSIPVTYRKAMYESLRCSARLVLQSPCGAEFVEACERGVEIGRVEEPIRPRASPFTIATAMSRHSAWNPARDVPAENA